MSINHYSSDLAQSQWWSHYMNMDSSAAQTSSSNHKPTTTHSDINPAFWLSPHHPNAAAPPMFSAAHNNAVSFDLNNEDDDESPHDEHVARDTAEPDQLEKRLIPKDRLFEKPLTPSDVGKLNRLVIPKQHAEKHFPLNGGDSGENGLLLGFEDELGKSWRFRYSYWNSSQSYVLTKGWSRFVKEKRLDAGDIVVFARHRVDAGRLFIGWRRRNSGGGQDAGAQAVVGSGGGGGGGWNRLYYSTQAYPSQQQQQHHGQSSLPSYQTDHCLHAGIILSHYITHFST